MYFYLVNIEFRAIDVFWIVLMHLELNVWIGRGFVNTGCNRIPFFIVSIVCMIYEGMNDEHETYEQNTENNP